jgi:hypothetical protein
MKNNLDSFWIICLALKRAVSFSVRTTLNVVYLQPCWTSEILVFISTCLYIVEYKFRKSCEQIKLLTRRLDLLQIRYNKAKRDDMKSFRYTQRLQLATLVKIRRC